MIDDRETMPNDTWQPEPAELHAELSRTFPVDWGDPIPTRAEIEDLHGARSTRASLDLLRGVVQGSDRATQQFLASIEPGGTAYQLECRVKSPESLARKLRTMNDKEAPVSTPKDVVRFTVVVAEPGELTDVTRSTADRLQDQGWRAESAHHSYVRGSRYRGVHANWLTPQGDHVEVQFHSRASIEVKHQTTDLYEVERDPGQSVGARRAARQECVRLSDELEMPAGLDDLATLAGVDVAVRSYGAPVQAGAERAVAATGSPNTVDHVPVHGKHRGHDGITR